MKSVVSGLLGASRREPKAQRVKDADGETWTNQRLGETLRRVAAQVVREVAVGSRVVLQTQSAGAFWAGFSGICSAGCDVIPLSSNAPPAILRRVREELDPKLWITDHEILRTSGDETATDVGVFGGAILLSSGTTGRSRFLRRGSEMLDLVARGLSDEGLYAPTHRAVNCLPLQHAYGLEHGFLAPALAGCGVLHTASFDPLWALGHLDHESAVLATVPQALRAMLEVPWRSPPRGCIIVAGTPLQPALRERFMAASRHVSLVDLYGATEIGTIWLDRGAGGKAVPGVEVRIDGLEEGEIHVRSRTRFDHYLDGQGRPENSFACSEDQWFRTGDLGRCRSDGSFAITGRSKLVFDVGGLKVNPFDVEAALEEHPAVSASLVSPIVLADGLCRVGARIEFRGGRASSASVPSVSQLRDFLMTRLPTHMIPRTIEVVDYLPRSASGKVLRDVDARE